MRIAMDAGGTFTDCVYVRNGRLEILKVPSTPAIPEQAIVDALEKVFPGLDSALELTCGTTVGTNALLQRKGGRAALVTTEGFEDVLEIGRQARPRLYDFFVQRTPPLVPGERRFGFRERIASDGRPALHPSHAEIDRIVRMVQRSKSESVAVCLLFSFANSAHERAIARALRDAGFEVSVSHEILPEFREFERTATTVANAYLVPVDEPLPRATFRESGRDLQAARSRGRPHHAIQWRNCFGPTCSSRTGPYSSLRSRGRNSRRTIRRALSRDFLASSLLIWAAPAQTSRSAIPAFAPATSSGRRFAHRRSDA